MDIPARPNKSSNPWYEAREAYDQAIEDAINQVDQKIALPSRGRIPDGSDLNDFYGPDYRGVWRFTFSTQMENAPISPNTSGVFEVISEGLTGENSTKQIFTNQAASYWREVNTASEGNWGDWHRNVVSPDIARIIRSKNAELPIRDSDLLVLIDTPSYFIDFSDQILGEAPSGWTPRWDDEGLHTIQRSPSSSNGVVLHHPSISDVAIKALSLDILDGITDVEDPIEVTFKWRGNFRSQPRAFTHGSGEGREDLTAIFGGYFSVRDTDGMVTFNDGVAGNIFYSPTDLVPNDGGWLITRFRVHPNRNLRIRTWKNGHPEPKSWHRLVTMTSFPAGWIGLATVGGGWTEYDWFGVALEGGRAPIGG